MSSENDLIPVRGGQLPFRCFLMRDEQPIIMFLVYCRQHRAEQGPISVWLGDRYVSNTAFPSKESIRRGVDYATAQVAGRRTDGKATTIANPSWLSYTDVHREEVD